MGLGHWLGITVLFAFLNFPSAFGKKKDLCLDPVIDSDSAFPNFEISALKLKPFDRDFFRNSLPDFSDEVFDKKWATAADTTPLLFFRSFVRAYYIDLASLKLSLKMRRCFGDLHPDNFGFEEFEEGRRYVFNDLDDSGSCPILYDILRYFISLRLRGEVKGTVESLIQFYLDEITSNHPILALPEKFNLDLDKVLAKRLKRFTAEDHFILSTLQPTNEAFRRPVRQLFLEDSRLKNLSLLDVARFPVVEGGSGGLTRTWALVENQKKERDLIEFKPLESPGTTGGKWEPDGDSSLSNLLAHFWKGLTPRYYFRVEMDGKNYLVRSRKRKSVDLTQLDKENRVSIYRVQLSQIAAYHRTQMSASEVPVEDWSPWLTTASQFFAKRYEKFFKTLKKGE